MDLCKIYPQDVYDCKKCRKMRLKKEASLQDDQNTADFVR